MAIRAVTFDYGGTLDGEASHWLDRFVTLYRRAGVDLPFDRIKEAFYHADDVCYADPRIAKTGLKELMEVHVGIQLGVLKISDADLEATLVEGFVSLSRSALDRSREILERLAGHYRLGVISNFYGNVGVILEEMRIAPLLTSIVDSNAVGVMKPDRRMFDLAVEGLGVPACDALHLGDSYERDVVAARAAGLNAVWLVGPEGGLANEDCVRSLDEFVVYLQARDGWQ